MFPGIIRYLLPAHLSAKSVSDQRLPAGAVAEGQGGGLLPFLKWPGGKRWIAPAVAEILADDTGRYIEPFLGAGAVFFRLRPEGALLADVNRDLMTVYGALRDQPDRLFESIRRLKINPMSYRRIRASRPMDRFHRAARFMYLNRTAFNGLYRVNRIGEFNVPFGGRATQPLFKRTDLRAYSRVLRGHHLMSRGYASTLRHAESSDRLFVDPPYPTQPGDDFFGRYHSTLFTATDQEKLAGVLIGLARSGTRIVVTNALNQNVLDLYPDTWFRAFVVQRISRVAASAKARRSVQELLLVSRSLAVPNHLVTGPAAQLTAFAR